MNTKKYFLFLMILLVSFSVIAQKRAFTIEDLYKIKNVSAPVLSNSGEKIAFTVTEYDLPKGKTITNLYVMDTNGSSLVSVSNTLAGAHSPFWSSKDELYVMCKSQVYKYSLATKDTVRVTDFYAGIQDPVLSNDGRYIAFVAELFPECGTDNDCNKKLDVSSSDGPMHAYIADNLLFRHWTDYKGEKESYLVLFDIKENKYQTIVKSDVL
ncbi:MAG: PD40 domain-containing protein, partial [Ignavibacterium sp.]|nr:PD40 domain-containing protein [Ignavibacterium sp.]